LSKGETELLKLSVTSDDEDITWMAKDIKWYRNNAHLAEFDDEFIIPVSYDSANSIYSVKFQINGVEYSAQATVFGSKTLLLVVIESSDGTVFVDKPIDTVLQ